jgi:hypothetical protein
VELGASWQDVTPAERQSQVRTRPGASQAEVGAAGNCADSSGAAEPGASFAVEDGLEACCRPEHAAHLDRASCELAAVVGIGGAEQRQGDSYLGT